MARALVTGGSGCVGSFVAERFSRAGMSVCATVRPTSDPVLLRRLGAELVAADLARDGPLRLPAGIDYVVHAASTVSDQAGELECRQSIVEGTRRLVRAVQEQCPGLKRFVYISSALVLGFDGAGISAQRPGRRSALFLPYVRAKRAAEGLLRAEFRLSGFPVVILRPTDVLGPRDRVVCMQLCRAIELGVPLVVGRGDKLFASCSGADVAEAAWRACVTDGVAGRCYTVANPVPVTWRRFLDALRTGLGRGRHSRVPAAAFFGATLASETARRILPLREAPLTWYRFLRATTSSTYDVSQTTAELGFEPACGVDARLAEIVSWYRSCQEGAA